jgi:hypothetical protein
MTRSRNLIRPKWQPTDDQVAVMRARYATTTTKALAAEFGVAYHQVAKLAEKLGLRKDEAFLSSLLDPATGKATRFQAGQTSWIAGKRLPGHGSPLTKYKRGQTPHNKVDIGSLRVNADGYLQIKLTDTGRSNVDWVAYHRHVWERANGPVPAGSVVVFLAGRRTTEPELVTLDAIELVTRRELMERNTCHRYGPEISKLIQLRTVLTRQIKKREREHA